MWPLLSILRRDVLIYFLLNETLDVLYYRTLLYFQRTERSTSSLDVWDEFKWALLNYKCIHSYRDSEAYLTFHDITDNVYCRWASRHSWRRTKLHFSLKTSGEIFPLSECEQKQLDKLRIVHCSGCYRKGRKVKESFAHPIGRN